jgi:hypothetical protein
MLCRLAGKVLAFTLEGVSSVATVRLGHLVGFKCGRGCLPLGCRLGPTFLFRCGNIRLTDLRPFFRAILFGCLMFNGGQLVPLGLEHFVELIAFSGGNRDG